MEDRITWNVGGQHFSLIDHDYEIITPIRDKYIKQEDEKAYLFMTRLAEKIKNLENRRSPSILSRKLSNLLS